MKRNIFKSPPYFFAELGNFGHFASLVRAVWHTFFQFPYRNLNSMFKYHAGMAGDIGAEGAVPHQNF